MMHKRQIDHRKIAAKLQPWEPSGTSIFASAPHQIAKLAEGYAGERHLEGTVYQAQQLNNRNAFSAPADVSRYRLGDVGEKGKGNADPERQSSELRGRFSDSSARDEARIHLA